jgi:gliding motility-associated-like protein
MTITAPYGFRYRWWRDGSTATVDTVQSITVAADGSHYHCELIDRFNPACSYTISRRVLQGPYVEVRDTVVQNHLPHNYGIQTFYGATDTTFTIPATVGCDTTVHYMLHVWPNQHSRIVRHFCPDQWPVTWHGHTFVGPDSVEVTYTDVHGADSVVTYVAVGAPAYELADTVTICPWRPFVYDGVDYGGPTTFDTLYATVDGCDSLVHVTLMPRDSTFSPVAYHSVDGQIWADTVPIVLCSNQHLQAMDYTQGAQSWHWVLGDSDSSDARNATFSFVRRDSVEVVELTLDVVSVLGCHDTVVWPVVVFPAPEADFEWNPEHPMDVDARVQLINNTVPDSCGWLWLIGEDSLTAFAPYYRWPGYTAPGDVDVKLKAMLTMQYDTIRHTCTDTATRQITIVTCYLQFPSLVTPNGDGVNDRWEVVNLVELGLYPQSEVWIYNQWGVLVFHAKDITDSDQFWDPNDRRCPDGTYYFRFMARNKYGIVRQNGVIEVLR